MIYKVGMLCKHFKGNNLLEKNIYRIEQIGVDGKDINSNLITYTGDKDLFTSKNLVVYSNIFQDIYRRTTNESSVKITNLSQRRRVMYHYQ